MASDRVEPRRSRAGRTSKNEPSPIKDDLAALERLRDRPAPRRGRQGGPEGRAEAGRAGLPEGGRAGQGRRLGEPRPGLPPRGPHPRRPRGPGEGRRAPEARRPLGDQLADRPDQRPQRLPRRGDRQLRVGPRDEDPRPRASTSAWTTRSSTPSAPSLYTRARREPLGSPERRDVPAAGRSPPTGGRSRSTPRTSPPTTASGLAYAELARSSRRRAVADRREPRSTAGRRLDPSDLATAADRGRPEATARPRAAAAVDARRGGRRRFVDGPRPDVRLAARPAPRGRRDARRRPAATRPTRPSGRALARALEVDPQGAAPAAQARRDRRGPRRGDRPQEQPGRRPERPVDRDPPAPPARRPRARTVPEQKADGMTALDDRPRTVRGVALSVLAPRPSPARPGLHARRRPRPSIAAPRRPGEARGGRRPTRSRTSGSSTSPRRRASTSSTPTAPPGEKLLPETMGSGVAFLDYDGDGDQDLFLVNSDDWPDAPEAAPADPGPLPQRRQGPLRGRDRRRPGSTGRSSAWAWPSATTTTTATPTSTSPPSAAATSSATTAGTFADVTDEANAAGLGRLAHQRRVLRHGERRRPRPVRLLLRRLVAPRPTAARTSSSPGPARGGPTARRPPSTGRSASSSATTAAGSPTSARRPASRSARPT